MPRKQTRGSTPQRVLPGVGPKSAAALSAIGIHSLEDLKSRDVYAVYGELKARFPWVSLNFLYGLIAVVEGIDWRVVQRTRRTEILLRLDDLGLAPKK